MSLLPHESSSLHGIADPVTLRLLLSLPPPPPPLLVQPAVFKKGQASSNTPEGRVIRAGIGGPDSPGPFCVETEKTPSRSWCLSTSRLPHASLRSAARCLRSKKPSRAKSKSSTERSAGGKTLGAPSQTSFEAALPLSFPLRLPEIFFSHAFPVFLPDSSVLLASAQLLLLPVCFPGLAQGTGTLPLPLAWPHPLVYLAPPLSTQEDTFRRRENGLKKKDLDLQVGGGTFDSQDQ